MRRKYLLMTVMVLSLLTSLLMLQPANVSAHEITQPDPNDHKVVVSGLAPGDTVQGYIGGQPILIGDTPAGTLGPNVTSFSGTAEVRVPKDMLSSIWVKSPSGSYMLLGVVSPGSTWPDTTFNAAQAAQPLMQAQLSQPGRGPGLAAPEGAPRSAPLLIPSGSIAIDARAVDGADTSDHKVIVTDVAAGSRVEGFIDGQPFLSNGTPSGMLGPDELSQTGGTVQIHLPLGKVSTVWVYTPGTGYRYLGYVAPSSPWPDTVFNAQAGMLPAAEPWQ